MKTTPPNLLRSGFAIAAGVFVTASAMALPITSGSLLIGFRASDGQGNATSYLINIGQYSQFNLLNGGSFTLNLGNTLADLEALYGDNWATRADLNWGIFGAQGSGNTATLYASRAEGGGAWSTLIGSARGSTASQINSVVTSYSNTPTAYGESPVAIGQANFAGAGSYNYQVTSGSTDFGTVSQWSNIETNFGSGVAGAALDLFRITGSGTTTGLLGTFDIDTDGAITYTSASVPEPSSMALLGIGALVALKSLRRRATQLA